MYTRKKIFNLKRMFGTLESYWNGLLNDVFNSNVQDWMDEVVPELISP